MKKIIILIGSPGCGKGTQARLLENKFIYGHLSTGELLREMSKDSNLSPEEQVILKSVTEEGKMAPNKLIYKLAFAKVKDFLDNGQGIVLDGAIRNLRQAKAFYDFFKKNNLQNEVVAMEISLTDAEAFERLSKRRYCSVCKENIPWTNATKNIEKCPKCSGDLKVRSDDDPAIIKKRIKKQGEKALRPILDYYAQSGILKRVDGMGSVEDVSRSIEMNLA